MTDFLEEMVIRIGCCLCLVTLGILSLFAPEWVWQNIRDFLKEATKEEV